MSKPRGPISIGIDIRDDHTIIAVVQGGARPALRTIASYATHRTSDSGQYRNSDAIRDAIEQTIRTYRSSKPKISISTPRRSTSYSTATLPGLTRNQAHKVITTQASRHFGNHAELHLAIAPATTQPKPPTRAKHWLIAGTPHNNITTLADALASLKATLTHYETPATATLRTITTLTNHGTHIVLNGSPDGGDITIINDGVIELIRSYRGDDLDHDILPELNRAIEYLKNQNHHHPHLHLASHHQHQQHLQHSLNLDNEHIHTPNLNDILDPNHDISDTETHASLTAIGLALGALPKYPNPITPLILNTTARAPTRTSSSSVTNGTLTLAIALTLLAAGGAYHLITELNTRTLRSDVQTLQNTLHSGAATPEQRIIEDLQRDIDHLQRHQRAVHHLNNQRTDTIKDLNDLNSAIPNSANADRNQATRYTSLSINHHTPNNDPNQPHTTTLITLNLITPNLTTLEHDLTNLERAPRFTPHLRHANRLNPNTPNDPTINAALHITLHPTPEHDPNTEPSERTHR